jgi:hypothetical protein
MFCHLNYNLDKKAFRDYFFKNFSRATHHKTAHSELTFWIKLFNVNEMTDSVIEDLNLTGFDISPRFSYQLKNTRLSYHIDIDRIVGININLMELPATIHLYGNPYEYEAALIDVGTKLHSVEPVEHDRLVLKLAIRNPWNEIYSRLKDKNLLDTSLDSYKSELSEYEKHLVKI